MSTERVAVFGVGPAGLSAASELADKGYSVDLFSANLPRVHHSVYTTDILVPPKLKELFFSSEHTRPLSHIRVITQNGSDFRVPTGGDYRVLDYPKILEGVERHLENHQNISLVTHPATVCNSAKVREINSHVVVDIDGASKRYMAVVDATGVKAQITNQALKETGKKPIPDYLVEYVYGATFRGHFETDEMILTMGPAGGTSWANPSMEAGGVDVVFSAWGPKSLYVDFLRSAKPRLMALRDFLNEKEGIEIDGVTPENVFAGVIRSHPTPPPSFQRIFQTGEAAGMAKPSTGDSIQRAIAAGPILAETIEKNPQTFTKKWKNTFGRGDNMFFAGTLCRLSHQERGDLGGMCDHMAEWLEDPKANSQRFIEAVEKYIIEGKLSPSLAIKIIRTPNTRKYLLQTALKTAAHRLKQPRLPSNLPLPPIDNIS